MLEVLNDNDYEQFRKVIYDECGITFSATNRSILDSRIKDLLRRKNLQTPAEYMALVLKNPDEMKEMLDSVTTNLTRFFRNQPHFDGPHNPCMECRLFYRRRAIYHCNDS